MELILKWMMAALLGMMAVWDIRIKKLPAALMIGLGLGLCLMDLLIGARMHWGQADFTKFCTGVLTGQLLGTIPGWLLWGLRRMTGGQVGMGDVWMLMMTGAFVGLQICVMVFMFSLSLIFFFSCLGLILRKLHRHSKVPFVPFYFIAYVGVVLI